ncbi:unnamed protein product [Lactuca saligna]|uniref:Uncharacterized protein n=1 Tax=Lactuca saligna TaxID=75948 RepID=A0AA35ZDU9_LACSI|nr:unnamed protein product [Lactuca saligna]
MHEPSTTLFYSQSTEAERIVQEDEPKNDDIMVSFADLQFILEGDNDPDNMIMLGKQFKILNNKLNSLLQIQTYIGGIEKQQVERLEVHARNFEYEIQKLRDVSKEFHELFVEHVKTMKESVDLKMVELKLEMAKEVEKIEKNYSVLHGKVYVVVDAIPKLVEYNTTYSTKLDVKSEQNCKVFAKLEEFFSSIKESISKIDLSTQSTVS